jgi:hypothetical protein
MHPNRKPCDPPSMLYHEPMWKSLKRWPVLVSLVVAVAALAVALVYLPFGSRVTRENCERIKEGMTEAEVRDILGKPWDDSLLDPEGPSERAVVSSNGPAAVYLSDLAYVEPIDRIGKHSHWVGSDFVLFVAFRNNGRVALAKVISDPDRPRSWLPGRVWRRLRARYGW